MSYELFIGRRYLRARRKQVFVSVITLLSIAGILLGVAALIIVLAVMNGFETDLRDKILGINSHIVLMEYSGVMRDPDRVLERVRRTEGVAAATPFVYAQAMLKSGPRVSGVVLRGMDTATASRVISLGRMREGKLAYLDAPPPPASGLSGDLRGVPGIVVGKELAKNLGLFLFEPLYVISPAGTATPMGMAPRMKKFVVVGIFDSGFYEYDSTLAYLSLRDSQELLQMGGSVTGIEIKIRDLYRADAAAKRLEQALGYPYWARHWMEMNKNLFSALKLEKRVMFIILSLIVLVAAFNIITTLIMVVMEKTKDIAVLKSMGATSRSIMRIFVFQGLIIGAVGTLLGCATGLSVAFNLEKISTTIETLFGFKILPGDVYYLSALPSQVNYGDVAVIVAGSLLISLLSTLYPSYRAGRLDPAETLRYE